MAYYYYIKNYIQEDPKEGVQLFNCLFRIYIFIFKFKFQILII